MTQRTHDVADAIAKTAERQMQRWAIALEVQERVGHERAVAELPGQVHPYVAISREAGAGGAEVARLVAGKLSWQLLDRELLHYMAESYNLPKDMLEYVDEKTSNWFYEIFGRYLDTRVVTQTEYVTHLGHILLMATRHAQSVIVGRGAQFLLPREKGLLIRIVAPRKRRIERMMELLQHNRDQATKYVERTDQERHDFVQRYFHHDGDDPHWYDIVINMQYVEPEGAAQLIVDQSQQRFRLPARSGGVVDAL